MLSLLTSIVESQWAILPKSLEAIVEIVQDHDKVFSRSVFHGSSEKEPLQAVVGSIGKPFKDSQFSSISGNVGILNIDGPIIPRSVNTPSSGPSASLEKFSRELLAMDASEEIQTIVLSIDSPGGLVTGVQEFGSLIRSLKTPVISFVYGYAASAAYWIAAQTSEIVVAETAELGSIGTVAVFEDRTAREEKQGVKRFEIVSNLSPNKRMDPQSDQGKAAILEILDDITKVFISNVAEGRGKTFDQVLETFGQGKMFIARKAVTIGMADRVDTLYNLINTLQVKSPLTMGINGTITNQQKAEGLNMSEKKNEDSIVTAEEFKTLNPSAYDEIFTLGVKAERDRLQSIESLSAKDHNVSAFVNKRKFEAGMTKEKMALAIFESKEEVFKEASSNVMKAGADLDAQAADIAGVNMSSDADAQGDEEALESSKAVAAMVAGAKDQFVKNHGRTLEESKNV